MRPSSPQELHAADLGVRAGGDRVGGYDHVHHPLEQPRQIWRTDDYTTGLPTRTHTHTHTLVTCPALCPSSSPLLLLL